MYDSQSSVAGLNGAGGELVPAISSSLGSRCHVLNWSPCLSIPLSSPVLDRGKERLETSMTFICIYIYICIYQTYVYHCSFLFSLSGVTLLQAIRILKEKLTAFPVQLSSFHQSAVFDYFSNTFLKHYWLYQFVMTRERDHNQTVAILEICAPPSPPPLSEGIDIEMWNFQQQLGALCAAEEEKQASILHIRETLLAEREHLLREVYQRVRSQTQILNTEVNEELIKTQIQNLHRIIQHEIQTTFEILELKLQKKALMFNSPDPYPPPFCPDLRGKKSSKPQKKTQANSLENEDKMDQKKKKK
uniref:Chromosome 8 open reading frame 74 n=1 Tax=Laticauda laticaudata TaxID=8630 RepID=A0A8C5SAU2_LATLA